MARGITAVCYRLRHESERIKGAPLISPQNRSTASEFYERKNHKRCDKRSFITQNYTRYNSFINSSSVFGNLHISHIDIHIYICLYKNICEFKDT